MRLFVSVPVGEEARTAMERAQSLLRTELSGVDLRFQNLEQSHLTLRFLGDLPETALPGCRSAVTAAARSAAPFILRTAQLGVFPGPKRPGVLWLGVAGETEVLEHVRKSLVRQLSPHVPPVAESNFRPHLTLCRIQQRLSAVDRERIIGLLSAEEPVPFATWRIGAVQLVRSRLLSNGAVHTVLHDASLTGDPG